jgi:hypothetical protein
VHGNPDALRKAAELLDRYEELWRHRVTQIDGILAGEAPAESPDS